MAGQQADSAPFHLASPGPGSSQYLCLDRSTRKGGKGVAGFISQAILALLWNPLSGASPFRKKSHFIFCPRGSHPTETGEGKGMTAQWGSTPGASIRPRGPTRS